MAWLSRTSLRTRLLLLVLLGLGVAACTTPGEQTIFDRQVVHPEALFDVPSRSAQIRRTHGGTGGRVGDRICVRERDLVDYGPLVGPSLAAVKGGGDTNRDARDFARALNMSAFYVLLTNDTARAQRDIAALRRHAEAGAWLVPNPSWTNAWAGMCRAWLAAGAMLA